VRLQQRLRAQRSRDGDVNRTVLLLLLFAVQALASATFAYPDMGRNWKFATDLLKIVTFCLVMPMLVTTRTRILAMVTVMALGMSFHGLPKRRCARFARMVRPRRACRTSSAAARRTR